MSESNAQDNTVDEAALRQKVGDAIAQATSLGASQAAAGASLDRGLSVTARMGDVETVQYQRDRSFGVTVYFGHRKGSASTADLDPAAITAAVEKAVSIARFTAEDACAGLAEPELMADVIPDLSLNHPWVLAPQEAIEQAIECEAAALAHDKRIKNSEGASIDSRKGLRVYGNSHGFRGAHETTMHSISCAVVADDGKHGMQRDYWYSVSRDPKNLEELAEVGRHAARRTVSRLGAHKISTRQTPVLYPPDLARGLIAHFLGAVNGASQYRQASFLLGAVGEHVMPDFISLTEKPHIPGGLGSAAFDDEGVATKDNVLVADGQLVRYVLSSYSARKLGLETTGNAGGIHNLEITTSDRDFAGMLKLLDTGFLVTELMGQGINPVTGDYSRGAAGYWVENGHVMTPVEEVTIAGNLKDMLKGIVAVGNDVDLRGSVRTGSVLIEQMTVAGD